jgi:hypothetical protein
VFYFAIVTVIAIVLVRVPEVPVMLMVKVPSVPPFGALIVRVSVTEPLVIVALGMEAVGPFFDNGLTLVEKLMVPVNPLNGLIVMVEVPVVPRLMVRLVGDAVSV